MRANRNIRSLDKRIEGIIGIKKNNIKLSDNSLNSPDDKICVNSEYVQWIFIDKWQREGQKLFMIGQEIDGSTDKTFNNEYERYEFLYGKKINRKDFKKILKLLIICSCILISDTLETIELKEL